MNPQNLSLRQIMNRLYKDVCGFEIPKDDEKHVKKSKGSPVYGEINHESVNKLLKYLNLKSDDIFFDLGSGVGKLVLHAALATPVMKAYGVELSMSRYLDALAAKKLATSWFPNIQNRCEFLNEDLLNVDLSKASVIYSCSTAFSEAFMKKIVAHLAHLTHDFRLVTLQDLPNEQHFELIDRIKLDMSWVRNTPVYIYHRRK